MRPKKNTPGEAAVASARPATSPEAQEQYMINLTMQLVERRLREGTASSAETTHFLKLATMKADLEKKKLEEDYKEAAELFKNAKFKQVYPLLKDLSNRGCARANALLYWLCYAEFNDKMAVTYAKKGYEAGDAIASIQYAFDCEIDPKKKKEIFL